MKTVKYILWKAFYVLCIITMPFYFVGNYADGDFIYMAMNTFVFLIAIHEIFIEKSLDKEYLNKKQL